MYLTYTATEFCKSHKRSTISAADVLEALEEIDFDDYVNPLQECLKHFRAKQQGKKEAKRQRDAAIKAKKMLEAQKAQGNSTSKAQGPESKETTSAGSNESSSAAATATAAAAAAQVNTAPA